MSAYGQDGDGHGAAPENGAQGSESSAHALIDALSGATWAERRELVARLATLPERAVAVVVEALITRRDDEARIAALVDTLVASSADVDEHMIRLASSPDPALLADVAQVLGRRRSLRGVPTLVRLTKHADDNVAVAAIEALDRAASHSAVEALVACVESNNFFRTFPAIDVLGRSGDPRAIEPLARLLANPRYAFEAARALGRSADKAAVAPLMMLLDAPSVASVRVGCLALSELCDRHEARYGVATAVEENLRRSCSTARVRRAGQSLSGADRSEVRAICRVLGAFRMPAATPWLVPLLDSVEPEVATAAAAALRTIGEDTEELLLAALREQHSARRAVLLPMVRKLEHADAVMQCLDDSDPTVRALACDAIARIGCAACTPELFQRLGDESARVVHAATAAIQSLGSDRTEALALEAARAPRVETRRAALRILTYFGWNSAYEAFRSALNDPDLRVRDAAVHGLALVEDERALALLCELAKSEDGKQRGAAMRALGQTSGDAAARAALRAGLDDDEAWVRYYACQALGKLHDEQSVSSIERLVRDVAGQVRVAALEALSLMSGQVALTALRLAVSSSDLDVRRAALLGLGLARDLSSLPLLLEAARSDEPATRLVALSALARFDAPEVTSALAAAAQDGDDSVRVAAIGYLAQSAAPAATSALIQLARAGVEVERALAALALPSPVRATVLLAALETADDEGAPLLASCLSRMRSDLSRDALFRALLAPNRAARLAAAHSISAFGTRDGYAALARAAGEDQDPEVRRVCALHLSS